MAQLRRQWDMRQEVEPRIVDCSALAAAGLWRADRCCGACHAGTCADPLALERDMGKGGMPGELRLHLCCAAACDVVLSADDFARLSGPAKR
jgi:hypothetical protein